ncbi:MAG: PEP-CTERM sorting domain-containing protein [Phycisphaerae bacterium]
MTLSFGKISAVLLGSAAGLMCSAGVFCTPVAATPVLNTNLLNDPGFEASPGPTGGPNASTGDVSTASGTYGWSGWNNWTPPYGAYYTSSIAHTGTQAGKTFSGPNGGIYQYVPVTGAGGYQFNASAWFYNMSGGNALNGQETDDIRVIFQNAAGTTLATDVSPTNLNAGSPTNTWMQLSVTGLVPTTATQAQVMMFFNNPGGTGGALFTDDANFSLSSVPEPASLGLLALGGLGMLLIGRKRVTGRNA